MYTNKLAKLSLPMIFLAASSCSILQSNDKKNTPESSFVTDSEIRIMATCRIVGHGIDDIARKYPLNNSKSLLDKFKITCATNNAEKTIILTDEQQKALNREFTNTRNKVCNLVNSLLNVADDAHVNRSVFTGDDVRGVCNSPAI